MSANNQINFLGASSNSGGAFSLTDARPFSLTGTLTSAGAGSNVTLTTTSTSGLSLDGNIAMGSVNTLTLNSAGIISQTAGNTITAGILTGSAGAAVLNSANHVGSLRDFSAPTGSIDFTDAQPLTAGALSAGATEGAFVQPYSGQPDQPLYPGDGGRKPVSRRSDLPPLALSAGLR